MDGERRAFHGRITTYPTQTRPSYSREARPQGPLAGEHGATPAETKKGGSRRPFVFAEPVAQRQDSLISFQTTGVQ